MTTDEEMTEMTSVTDLVPVLNKKTYIGIFTENLPATRRKRM